LPTHYRNYEVEAEGIFDLNIPKLYEELPISGVAYAYAHPDSLHFTN